MAYQNPTFSFLHVYRDGGAAALTHYPATLLASGPKDYLIDNRNGGLAVSASSDTDGHWIVNRGAAGLETYDRLIIPNGHNLSGRTITISEDDNSGFTSATTIASSIGPVPSGLCVLDFTNAGSQEQYIIVSLDTSTSFAWQLGELVLTRKRTLTRGPDPNWTRDPIDQVLGYTSSAGVESFRVLGATRREIEMTYRAVSGADLTLLDELAAACGTHTPFWFDPPDDTFATLFVRLTDFRVDQDFRNPAGGLSYRYRLRMREVLG